MSCDLQILHDILISFVQLRYSILFWIAFHLLFPPSFTIFPNQNHIPNHNLYKRDRTNFKDKADFMLFREDFLNIDWPKTLQLEKNDENLYFDIFHDSTEALLDKYLPLKKLSNKDHKRKYKPWITLGILTSINKRNKLFSKYTRTKNLHKKNMLPAEYKILRNRIIDLIKTSKHSFSRITLKQILTTSEIFGKE